MPPAMRPSALILSASAEAKEASLTRLGARTLIEAHVAAFRRAQLTEIAVVWRGDGHELPAGCGNVRVVLQPEADATAFDSLVLGLFALDRAPVLVLPSATDLVDDDTLEMLVAEAHDVPHAFAIVPRFGDRHGHPVALLRAGVEAVVRDAAQRPGLHRLDRLLASWPSVRPLDVCDEAVARLFPRPQTRSRP